MRKAVCPISKKPFNCSDCTLIVDGEKCPYMTLDKQNEKILRFIRKVVEKENAISKSS